MGHCFLMRRSIRLRIMQITEFIKRLRAAGLSQSEIARRTGIPQPRLSRWEAGEVPASAEDGLKLAALAEQLCPAERAA